MTEPHEVIIHIDHDIYEWIERCRRDHSLTSFVNMLLRENMPEYFRISTETNQNN